MDRTHTSATEGKVDLSADTGDVKLSRIVCMTLPKLDRKLGIVANKNDSKYSIPPPQDSLPPDSLENTVMDNSGNHRRSPVLVVKPEPGLDIGIELSFEPSGRPQAAKRRRMLMDAVVVPTRALVARRRDQDMKVKMETLCNPAFKIKKDQNQAISFRSVASRIDVIGWEHYDVGVDRDFRDVCVSRLLISSIYGGNVQDTFPAIRKEKLREHGLDDFMCLSLYFNPHGPEIPGAPGLFFSTNMGHDGWSKIQRVIVRILSHRWQYQGQYSMTAGPPLTVAEWKGLSAKVRSTWCTKTCKKKWGIALRVRMTLRKRLRRNPTKTEVEEAQLDRANYENVTPEEVAAAFERGDESIVVWLMKCVGYDKGFQQKLVEASKTWVPPPVKPKQAKGSKNHQQAGRPEKAARILGGKRKWQDDPSDDELEDQENQGGNEADEYEDEDDRLDEFVPHGTRSRPIRI